MVFSKTISKIYNALHILLKFEIITSIWELNILSSVISNIVEFLGQGISNSLCRPTIFFIG
jgi:hypothetical protein